MSVVALCLMSHLAAAPVTKTQLPQPEWKAGLKWTHERDSTNDVSLIRGEKRSHKLHTRHELVKERLISKNGNDATVDVEIVTKTLTTKDLLAGTSETKQDPASGRTYRVASVGNQYTVTRDGAEVSPAEKRSAIESALDFGQLSAAQLPASAVGESFALDANSQAQLDRVKDGVAEFTVKSAMTRQRITLEKTQRARVEVKTGRLLSLEGEGLVTQPDEPDGTVHEPGRQTSKVVYSY